MSTGGTNGSDSNRWQSRSTQCQEAKVIIRAAPLCSSSFLHLGHHEKVLATLKDCLLCSVNPENALEDLRVSPS